jgi:hypothetical protein
MTSTIIKDEILNHIKIVLFNNGAAFGVILFMIITMPIWIIPTLIVLILCCPCIVCASIVLVMYSFTQRS